MQRMGLKPGVAAALLLVASTAAAGESPRTVHVYVALCDNASQGIAPVPAALGDGDDPDGNLYWGAQYGIRTHFGRSRDWQLIDKRRDLDALILERLVFRHRSREVYLVADGYRGSRIQTAIGDFLQAAAGRARAALTTDGVQLGLGSDADLLVYVGHDGLMEFDVTPPPENRDGKIRDVAVLACFSQRYFGAYLRRAGARPLLVTRSLLAPEAYVVEGALQAWLDGHVEAMPRAAAAQYARYQRQPLSRVRGIFAAGAAAR